MKDIFDYLFWQFLNGGAPAEDAAHLPSDWHEIKAWAETLLCVRRE